MMTTKIGVQAAADYLNGAFQTGWIPGEQEDLSSPTLKKPVTVEYVAANQMAIRGLDWRDRIQKGTKIRYKQGDIYKYDFVSSVAFSTDTTLTLMGGSTVTSEPITEFWFSNSATPLGWPFGVNYIEGFNENGTWRKWADGTLECWTRVTATYFNEKSLSKEWVYPVEFAAAPIAHADLTINAKIGGNDVPWYFSRWIIINPYLHYADIAVLTGHEIEAMTSYSFQSDDYQELLITAKGRWK